MGASVPPHPHQVGAATGVLTNFVVEPFIAHEQADEHCTLCAACVPVPLSGSHTLPLAPVSCCGLYEYAVLASL